MDIDDLAQAAAASSRSLASHPANNGSLAASSSTTANGDGVHAVGFGGLQGHEHSSSIPESSSRHQHQAGGGHNNGSYGLQQQQQQQQQRIGAGSGPPEASSSLRASISSSVGGGGGGAGSGKNQKVCDVCRKRKIKCVQQTTSAAEIDRQLGRHVPCVGCANLEVECTYLHVRRKPGRPNGFASSARSSAGGNGSSSSRPAPSRQRHSSNTTSSSSTVVPGGHRYSHPPPGAGSDGGLGGSGDDQDPLMDADPYSYVKRDDMSPVYQAPLPTHSQAVPTSATLASSSGYSVDRLMEGVAADAAGNGAAGGIVTSYVRSPPDTQIDPRLAGSPTAFASFAAPSGVSSGRRGEASSSRANEPRLPGISPNESDAQPSRYSFVHFDTPAQPPSSTGPSGSSHTRFMMAGSEPPREPLSNMVGGGGGASDWTTAGHMPAIMPTASDKDTPSDHPGVNHSSTSAGSAGGAFRPGRTRFQNFYSQLRLPDIQLEDVTSWSTLGFFTSLYLRHLHALLPLVHKPTFTLALAMRLDQRDVQFRAFLFSLVAYVICQSPMTRMIQAYSQPELERLQRDCHRASKLLQDRKYKSPSLIQVLTLILDYYYCAAVGKQSQAAALLGEAIQMAYIMRLNDDTRMRAMGLDCCEIELRRRTFWHMYAIDTTEASGGMPLHLNDHEGHPAFPQEVDDDLITSQGTFTQPPGRTSYMTGFVALSRIFRILAECLLRHRRYVRAPTQHDTLREASEWIFEANERLRRIMDELPPALQTSGPSSEPNEEAAAVFGMQRANLIITAATVKFALYDFNSDLDPDAQDIMREREVVSKEMYSMLASIPLDSLAANGESMRAKVLRIILALDKDPNKWSDSLRDWWDMFSMVQFMQAIDSVMPSRAPSPRD